MNLASFLHNMVGYSGRPQKTKLWWAALIFLHLDRNVPFLSPNLVTLVETAFQVFISLGHILQNPGSNFIIMNR